jgi:hypothetical protein
MKLSSTKKNRPAPAGPVETVQLGDHLCRRLGARTMPEHRGDVAELAVERAAARELHAHRGVTLHVRQLPQRRRRPADVGELRRRIYAPCSVALEVTQKLRQCHLRFIQHEMVNFGKLFVAQGEQRPARHDRLPRCAATRDQFVRRVLLGDHPADEHDIRPGQILFAQFPHVDIHEALRPFLRQHRRHGEQTQGRQRSFFADKFQRVFETPERVREFRV